MRNGYALCSATDLTKGTTLLEKCNPKYVDDIRKRLSIGLHCGVEVTAPGAQGDHRVSQAYCSAMPVAYCQLPLREWRAFATLILEAAYEATLLAGAIRAAEGGSKIVLLTLLGDGVFGNPREWIFGAIRRAITQLKDCDLDIRIVSYSKPGRDLMQLVGSF